MKKRHTLPLEFGDWQLTKLLGEKLIKEIFFSPLLPCPGKEEKQTNSKQA